MIIDKLSLATSFGTSGLVGLAAVQAVVSHDVLQPNTLIPVGSAIAALVVVWRLAKSVGQYASDAAAAREEMRQAAKERERLTVQVERLAEQVAELRGRLGR